MLSRQERFGLNLLVYAKLISTLTVGIGFVSLLAIFRKKLRLSGREMLFIASVLFQVMFSIILSGSISALTNTLFYFSFVPVYIFLKDKDEQSLIEFLRYLIIAMFLFSLVEFIALNTYFNKFVWYFPEDSIHRALILDMQRAQGLGSISSSSGSVAVLTLALYSLVAQKSLRFYGLLVFLTIVLLMSGTGFFVFFLYVLLQVIIKRRGVTGLLLSGALISIALVIALFVFEEIGLNRFTVDYFISILEVKVDQYAVSVFNKDTFSVIFGGQADRENSIISTTSDFGILGLFDGMGIMSVVLVLSAPILLVGYEKGFVIILILYLVSWLHYPSMGSPVGCVFLGIFLAIYKKHHYRTSHARNNSGSLIIPKISALH